MNSFESSRAQLDREAAMAKTNGATETPDFPFQTLAEFVQRPKVSSHVRGVIPAHAFVVVFGPPKGGKTFSVCDLTMHAAHGMDWHGCPIPRRMRVVYLAGEGVNGLRVRLKAWQENPLVTRVND